MTSPIPGVARPDAIFSHPIEVAAVPEGGLDVSIEADPAALRALAAADDLPSIARLSADFHIARKGPESFNVSGEVRARVTQICVVTLEPFESDLVEEVDVDFAAPDVAARAAAAAALLAGEAAQAAQERDPPDPIIDGKIDLGALASEFLALGLDPYPRKPGAHFDSNLQEAAPENDGEGPFAALRKLKDHP